MHPDGQLLSAVSVVVAAALCSSVLSSSSSSAAVSSAFSTTAGFGWLRLIPCGEWTAEIRIRIQHLEAKRPADGQ